MRKVAYAVVFLAIFASYLSTTAKDGPRHASIYLWARIQRELPAAAGALREVARFGSDLVFELR
jgi:hypothetical protein